MSKSPPFELPIEKEELTTSFYHIKDLIFPYTKDEADYIVQVINSHKNLIKACEYALEVIEKNDNWWIDCPEKGGFDTEIFEQVLKEADKAK